MTQPHDSLGMCVCIFGALRSLTQGKNLSVCTLHFSMNPFSVLHQGAAFNLFQLSSR